MRIESGLWSWAAAYAGQRQLTRTAVVEAALRELRDAAQGGVPARGSVGVAAAKAGASRAASRVPVKPAFVDRSWDRQTKLNEAKYGRKR